jgi:scyllo-inositol 2-dehydrogenase (NADP+)
MKVALIGTGWAITEQLPAFRRAGLEVYAIYSRDEKRAKELSEKYDIKVSTNDYDKILSDENVDLVSIVVPTYLHFDFVKKAMKANKMILCEKPFTLNLEESKILSEMSKVSCF